MLQVVSAGEDTFVNVWSLPDFESKGSSEVSSESLTRAHLVFGSHATPCLAHTPPPAKIIVYAGLSAVLVLCERPAAHWRAILQARRHRFREEAIPARLRGPLGEQCCSHEMDVIQSFTNNLLPWQGRNKQHCNGSLRCRHGHDTGASTGAPPQRAK
jgi:hypothetical protein